MISSYRNAAGISVTSPMMMSCPSVRLCRLLAPATLPTGVMKAMPAPGISSPISRTRRAISRAALARVVMAHRSVFSVSSRPRSPSSFLPAVPRQGRLWTVLTPFSPRKSRNASPSSRPTIRFIRHRSCMMHPPPCGDGTRRSFDDLFRLRLRRGRLRLALPAFEHQPQHLERDQRRHGDHGHHAEGVGRHVPAHGGARAHGHGQ